MLSAWDKHFKRRACAAGLACMLLNHEAGAELNSKERLMALAKLPDWTGVWESSGGATGNPPKPTANTRPSSLPYNATWQTKFEATQKNLNAITTEEQVPDNAVTQCIWGLPRIFAGPYTFEITVLPEQTFINYDVNEYRHIWTDGRKHPLLTPPSDMGHSVAHWEGETLVVDTISLRSGIWVNSAGATLSEKATITERWNQTDRDHLRVEVTVQDPLALLKPYTLTHRYQRIIDTNRQLQQTCFETMHEVRERDKAITKFTR